MTFGGMGRRTGGWKVGLKGVIRHHTRGFPDFLLRTSQSFHLRVSTDVCEKGLTLSFTVPKD